MAALPPEELWALWKQEQLAPEMAIGQLIQNQVKQQAEIERQGRTLSTLQAQMDRLLAQPGLPAQAKAKKQPPRRG